MSEETLYQTLGVLPCATFEEIESAYKVLARKEHPDIGGDLCKFQKLTEAKRVLLDAKERKKYDDRLALLRAVCDECKGAGRRWRQKGWGGGRWVTCEKCGGVGYD